MLGELFVPRRRLWSFVTHVPSFLVAGGGGGVAVEEGSLLYSSEDGRLAVFFHSCSDFRYGYPY